jgi:hypothetical protein
MFERFKKNPAPETVKDFVSVSRRAQQRGISYAEAAAEMSAMGQISKTDPRTALQPARIRDFSRNRMSELMHQFQTSAKEGLKSAPSLRERVMYHAVIMAGKDQLKSLDGNAMNGGEIATSMEFAAMQIAKKNPNSKQASELLHLAAAGVERTQRDRAMLGFETNNIATAAKRQGRSWLEVRDDLVKHNLLDPKDPRRKIRVADVKGIKASPAFRSNVQPADEVEKIAMARLKKNPKDEMALGMLSVSGALSDKKLPAHLKDLHKPKPKIFSGMSR